jgi:cytochrome b561
MAKSKPDRYGAVAVSIHWITAALILVLLGSGFRAANAMDPVAKGAFLRIHIPLAVAILLLTLFRVVWWWLFDRKPRPVQGSPAWQEWLAWATHVAFYIVILGMVASGIGMMVLSDAAPDIFAGSSTLPDFNDFLPRVPHGLGAFLLVALLVAHIGAALYHHFIRRDGLLRRMWFGR